MNLQSNALKFTRKGSVTFKVQITNTLFNSGHEENQGDEPDPQEDKYYLQV